MNFYTALEQVAKREMIRRESWDDKDIYVNLHGGLLSIHNDGATTDAWVISQSDLKADDWMLYGEIEEGEISEN